ncbi:uncharacterized protein LOC135811300 isoform X1 [Sycon ciliatum]|uniref:uncharacterized protein LOC135811300 isoform X1 n=1 Tax=Sycon ciliatum TaxID=27933 RepID=UPI0031F710B1
MLFRRKTVWSIVSFAAGACTAMYHCFSALLLELANSRPAQVVVHGCCVLWVYILSLYQVHTRWPGWKGTKRRSTRRNGGPNSKGEQSDTGTKLLDPAAELTLDLEDVHRLGDSGIVTAAASETALQDQASWLKRVTRRSLGLVTSALQTAMADLAYVDSADETGHSASDTDSEEDHTGMAKDEVDTGFLHDASSWLSSTKDVIANYSRSAMFTGMQGVLSLYAGSAMLHDEADPYPVDKLSDGPRPGDRILIIGAGPAGVHMAMKMQKRGHAVTILEKEQIGGKAYTVNHREAAHEMGACYLSPDYELVVELLQEYGMSSQLDVKQRTVWTDAKKDVGGKLRDWFYQAAKEAENDLDAKDSAIAWEIFKQAIHYISHHRRLLLNYEETGFLPPRPSAEHLEELQMSIADFFDKYELRALKPIFKLAYTLQGYGFVEEEPILYGMLWVTPPLLNGLIEMLKVRKVLHKRRLRKRMGTPRSITTLEKGFRPLFEAIIARCQDRASLPGKQPFRVLQQTVITKLERTDTDVTVEFHRECTNEQGTVKESTVTETFDFLIMAAPIPQVRDLIDLREDEKKLFSSLHESTFFTSLVDYRPAKQSNDTSVDNWLDNITLDRPLKVWASRDSHHLLRENGRPVRIDNEDIGTLVAYQYVPGSVHNHADDTPAVIVEEKIQVEKEAAKEELMSHFERAGKDVVNCSQYRFRYFPRHNKESIGQGILWDIMEAQGRYKTWYVGAPMCFEAINAIFGYNEQLFKVWDRQLEDETVLGERERSMNAENGGGETCSMAHDGEGRSNAAAGDEERPTTSSRL